MDSRMQIAQFCSGKIRQALENADNEIFADAEEIRIRAGKGMKIKRRNKEVYLDEKGNITDKEHAFVPEREELQQTALFLSGYSPFAYKEFISSGFITICGGHRVGISGHAVIKDGKVEMVRDVSSFNIRIARSVKDCGKSLMKYIDGNKIKNTVIVSPPGCGKTTVLRDLARIISDGGKNVSVVDERGEIAAVYKGNAQNDVGHNTDVLDGFSKAEGMIIALRSLGPDVIVCDEVGSESDIDAIKTISLCGVSMICTVHGNCIEDVRKRLKEAAEEFEVFVLLKKDKGVRKAVIYDRKNMIGDEVL